MQAVDLKDLRVGDFVEFVDRTPRACLVSTVPEAWHIVLIEPQQELTTGWRLHELGLELYSPIVRRQVKTGKMNKSGRKVMRVAPRPMFPGYGFLPTTAVTDLNIIREVKGVRDFLNVKGKPAWLPHDAIMAIRTKEYDEHLAYLGEIAPKKRVPRFRAGDMVRIETGPFADQIRHVEQADSIGRIMVLHGMVRQWMEQEDVIAVHCE